MSRSKDFDYWKERTRKFGEASVGYGCNKRLIRWDNVLRARAISRLVTIKPGMRVLDVGTGGGYWAIKYATQGANVVGLDFNEEILKIARARAGEAGVKITWQHGPLEKAELPADSFDLALSVTCLQHIMDSGRQAEAVRRILRSLKRDGIFVLLEDTPPGHLKGGDYMTAYSQQEWIDLVQTQGARILDIVGVSFIRFRFKHIPVPLCVGIDYMIGQVFHLKKRAVVTAFAFGV